MKLFSRIPAGPQCMNRVPEWVCAFMMLNFSFTTFASPLTIEKGSFKYLIVIGVTAGVFKWSLLVVGAARVAALYFNGYGLPWSARVRAFTALVGALMFGYMALCLAYLTKDTGTVSIGVGTHMILAGLEIYSCLRAALDVNESIRDRPYVDGGIRSK